MQRFSKDKEQRESNIFCGAADQICHYKDSIAATQTLLPSDAHFIINRHQLK